MASVLNAGIHRTAVLALAASTLASCGGGLRRFPLRRPLWVDNDLGEVTVPCRPDPEDAAHRLCRPEEYVSPFAWDGADNIVFRPIARFFAVDPGGEAANVNAFDEVPDSAWFTNRIGMHPMAVEDFVSGSCGSAVLDPNMPDGSWVIDMGKPNGANPGFRVNVPGVGKFMLKADPSDQPERATGATSIAARFYHAAGWNAPCDSVVYFRPSVLRLTPGLQVTDNSGVTSPFDRAALDRVLVIASHRGELVRMVASRWLPGRTIGPFRYEGTRDDDPNDVIPHEDRRDLRGARLIAAWFNHFDSREQNSMDTWMATSHEDKDSSPGHVLHWYIDLGDCFGSEWASDGISRRLGHAYYLDIPYVLEDFLTLGLVRRPWDRARRAPQARIFGYFTARDFDPAMWRGGYPNPSFGRATERDDAWTARILARFTNRYVAAGVRVGDYTNPVHARYLERQLLLRRDVILRRYLSRLSPITDLTVRADELCAVDLGRRTGIAARGDFHYTATEYGGETLEPRSELEVRTRGRGELCLTLARVAGDSTAPAGSLSRYVVVDIDNGHARGPLRAHLYDLGTRRGFRLVGIERPDDFDPPSP